MSRHKFREGDQSAVTLDTGNPRIDNRPTPTFWLCVNPGCMEGVITSPAELGEAYRRPCEGTPS